MPEPRDEAEFLAELFEFEFCDECGGDAEHHRVVYDPLGNLFAQCIYPPCECCGRAAPEIVAFRREAGDDVFWSSDPTV